ncbi:hypothetical protein BCR35DRAFT_332069 [Leucosporidium creatinivorum]|uniref:MYND-type domain-containing protein n=1 Tax=Leucosporidium creatinivorum TaxID=106004 RepID=A0A1Y2F602_9BASI|nr:hypothetical protein BCR35DRAFT_332069 [Leucosporidium creatinivorum]
MSVPDVRGTLKLCAKCRQAEYCSQECQTAAWPAHKQYCSRTAISWETVDTKPYHQTLDLWMKAATPAFAMFLRSALQIGRPSSIRSEYVVQLKVSSPNLTGATAFPPRSIFRVETISLRNIAEELERVKLAGNNVHREARLAYVANAVKVEVKEKPEAELVGVCVEPRGDLTQYGGCIPVVFFNFRSARTQTDINLLLFTDKVLREATPERAKEMVRKELFKLLDELWDPAMDATKREEMLLRKIELL